MTEFNLTGINTEKRNINSMDIDTKSTLDILSIINQEDMSVPQAVRNSLMQIAPLIDAAYERLLKGGRIFYVGAGTSGRLGVLDASECPPTYGVSSDLFIGLIAGGPEALLKAKEGAEDSMELAKEDLISCHLTKDDTVIGIAASGRTPYVIGALKYANEIGALTGSIACVMNAEISKEATYSIEAITGAEVVTGSTRMKAGTAQKLILNMISTTLMIKYGKVYQNLMVDVQPTNEKLNIRAINIIAEATGCDHHLAKEYFLKSDKDVKIAICMYLTKENKEICKALLEKYQGNASKVIHDLLKNR